ncbi:MAG TPA: hypothetical protein VK447_03565 [Myxococcaceae bacterium]|nr:hypothetical protein [Myxococcaceae bacterium]
MVLPDFQREFTTPLLRMGEQAPPLFLKSFVATCIARPAADLTCLEAQLEECEALEGVLRMTSKAFAAELMSSLTPEQRIATAVESARSEARFVLEAIGAGARAHQAEAADPSTYQFPGAVGITPAEDCCSQGGQCIPDEATWARPT